MHNLKVKFLGRGIVPFLDSRKKTAISATKKFENYGTVLDVSLPLMLVLIPPHEDF